MEDLYEDLIKNFFPKQDDVDTNAFMRAYFKVVDISMLLEVNVKKISTKPLKILNRKD